MVDILSDRSTSAFAGESNFEPSMDENIDHHYYSRCYWTGKNFFTYMLADAVLRSAPQSWTANDLEIELMEATLKFPYQPCTEKVDALKAVTIQNDGRRRNDHDHWIFLTKLGGVLEIEPGLRTKLASLVQSRGGKVAFDPNADHKMPPSPPESVNGEMNGDERIALYGVALNEWCQRQEKPRRFVDHQVKLDPPIWETELHVDGGTFPGRAKRKAVAHHLAAKTACEELKIEVSI